MHDAFYLLSLKHTRKNDPYVGFWGPNNSGYTMALDSAGLYAGDVVREKAFAYNDGIDVLAVPLADARALGTPSLDGGHYFPSDVGPVVKNTPDNIEAMFRAAVTRAAQHEAEHAVAQKYDYPGYAEILARIAHLVSTEDLSLSQMKTLWGARGRLLADGFHGKAAQSDDTLALATKAVEKIEAKLAVQPLAPAPR